MKIFENRGHQVDYKPTMPEEELLQTIGDYEGLVVRSATKVLLIYFYYSIVKYSLSTFDVLFVWCACL